ncbi:MAG TPA: hypothetical protein PKE26_03870 [Kiritimatiellia bacterium]|nr:hypothetical protein [Kiritimatiellia bacterium]HMO98228.1 hypothetical protein [Kiritimatiellia bacterium]HMP97195.1 hypothetical protein [Kiritimatiellia bacterium]
MSEDQNNAAPSSDNAETPEIVKTGGGRVEVSADLLNEAVTQLRKLTELRQRESERQERAMAQMHTAIKRQGLLSRYVILTCTLAVLICVGIAYLVRQSAKQEAVTAETLSQVDERLSVATQTIAQESQRQAGGLEQVRSEVAGAREEQVRLSGGIVQEMQAARESQTVVIQKVEEQLGAVREERDHVRGEVRSVLEEKTRQFTEREIALRAEREAIKEAKQRSKEEQKALIEQTIERLNAMTAALSIAEDDAGAPTDAEIDDLITEVEAVEAKIAEAQTEVMESEEAPEAGDTLDQASETDSDTEPAAEESVEPEANLEE